MQRLILNQNSGQYPDTFNSLGFKFINIDFESSLELFNSWIALVAQ